MPDYLRKLYAAQDVRFVELERVTAHGVNAHHSSTYAHYCCIEAALRAAMMRGETFTTAIYKERGMLAELLGICGLSGRKTKGAVTDPLSSAPNAFAALPGA